MITRAGHSHGYEIPVNPMIEKGVSTMIESNVLDKTFHIIMQRMVKTGQAPHHTEIAAELV